MIKKERKSQKLYLKDYNLLTVQNLWQAHYKILVINPLKEFIELKVNTDTMIKNVKLAEVNTKIANAVLKTQILKVI